MRKKLLFFINTLSCGGAEKVLLDTVNNLAFEDLDITVQTLLNDGVYRSQLDNKIKYKTILNIKSKILSKILRVVFIKILPPKLIYNFFIKDDYDYEISFLEGLPTKIISQSTNKRAKKVAWVHTDLVEYPSSFLVFGTEKKEKNAYAKFDSIACVSNGVRDAFIKKYGMSEKTKTVYNITDEQNILNFAKEECEIEKKSFLMVSVGRLVEQKAYDRLLRIQKRLKDENILSELWIIGEGQKRADLELFIKQNNLDNVKLLGFQKNPYKYMAKADVFVSSSIVEGYSMVITEAVVLGIPVISTNTTGVCEPIETPRCSVVVNDEEELFAALKTVLTDDSKLSELKKDVMSKRYYFKKENLLAKLKEYLGLGEQF